MMSGFGETPVAAGSVLGIRYWNLRLSGRNDQKLALEGRLGRQWKPRPSRRGESYRASCLFPHKGERKLSWLLDREVPRAGCRCGFWAYWHPDPFPGEDVAGVIEGFGRVITGERGFRSQKAWIRALAPVHGEDRAGTARLLEAFGVPVYQDVTRMLADVPLTRDYLPARGACLNFHNDSAAQLVLRWMTRPDGLSDTAAMAWLSSCGCVRCLGMIRDAMAAWGRR